MKHVFGMNGIPNYTSLPISAAPRLRGPAPLGAISASIDKKLAMFKEEGRRKKEEGRKKNIRCSYSAFFLLASAFLLPAKSGKRCSTFPVRCLHDVQEFLPRISRITQI